MTFTAAESFAKLTLEAAAAAADAAAAPLPKISSFHEKNLRSLQKTNKLLLPTSMKTMFSMTTFEKLNSNEKCKSKEVREIEDRSHFV